MIARWMDLICQATQTEITSEELARYWFVALKDYPIAAINRAFDEYMKHGADEQGRFFRPAPAQIIRLCEEWVDRQSGPKSGEALAKIDEWKSDPEAKYGMPDVAAEFQKLMKDKGIL